MTYAASNTVVVNRGRRTAWKLLAAALTMMAAVSAVQAAPLNAAARARLAAGQTVQVVVEFAVSAIDRAAATERARRHLNHDDAAILALRARGYGVIKAAVEAAESGPDARRVRDYTYLPLSVWRLSSLAALRRLEANPAVRAVHADIRLHVDSVSDLGFIDQPQTSAEGAIGVGTTIAVIDGGLGSNYLNYSDFGPCTAVDTPPSTCRVVYDRDFYPGKSTETVHGTNVSAIALGVAPGASLAMFDVFNGASASSSDILTAIDTILSDRSTYNIVAVNLSLGDGTSKASPCGDSVFASAITSLGNAGVASVIAAGNSGSKTGLSDPACVPGAISVGAVYDMAYGSVTWVATADSGGQCTDASAPDLVTCFSQSASYLSMLGPGTFVNAPSSAFQQSGTSQATPHISGSVAVLRARYPAEALSETLQRMQSTGVQDVDPGSGLSLPRLNLLAATNEGTAVALSGNGPTQAIAGDTSIYTITITNSGPLAATDVKLADSLPGTATFESATGGCTVAGSTVTCSAGTLAANAAVTFTITVTWAASGPVYDNAALSLDQNDSTSASQQLAFGTPPSPADEPADTDGPLPLWSLMLLATALLIVCGRHRHHDQGCVDSG